MERSIEDIWKEGFLESKALVVPEINDLYSVKSQNVASRMFRMMRINIILLFSIATALLIYSLVVSLPTIVGLLLFGLFLIPGLYSIGQMKTVRELDNGLNSYEYLRSFRNMIDQQIQRNILIARFYYPASVLSAFTILWYSDGREKLMNEILSKYPDLPMVGIFPLYLVILVLLIIVIFVVFAGRIYRWDIGLLYRRILGRMDELLSDMEQLRK